jgi:hypothetical protein
MQLIGVLPTGRVEEVTSVGRFTSGSSAQPPGAADGSVGRAAVTAGLPLLAAGFPLGEDAAVLTYDSASPLGGERGAGHEASAISWASPLHIEPIDRPATPKTPGSAPGPVWRASSQSPDLMF